MTTALGVPVASTQHLLLLSSSWMSGGLGPLSPSWPGSQGVGGLALGLLEFVGSFSSTEL